MMYAASDIISGFRDLSYISCPPSTFATAAVLMAVLGQSAFTAILPEYSAAIPSTHILILNLAIVYASEPWNQSGSISSGGDKFKICGFSDFSK